MSGGLFDDARTAQGDFRCPWCDSPNNRATNIGPDEVLPGAGDFGLCAECSRPSMYQQHSKPRKPTEAEWKKLNDDPDITRVRRAIFMLNKGNVSYDHLGSGTDE